MAVANAQEYASQREIAHRLQLGLLATPAVSVPGLEVAARYRPAQADAHVGGDWYDMFELADGRIALVIGDVMGHDITAAAGMGQLRTLLRGLSYDGAAPPDAILRRLDEINGGLAITDFATVALVNVDAVTPGGPAVLRYSNAGHLPLLVIHPDGSTALVGMPGDPPLGVGGDVARRCETLELPPGATLVLYTDGLVETRDAVLTERLALLERTAGELRDRSPGDLLDELLAVFDGHADDVAMLAMRVEAAR
jgi:serine phosphatase RsbU (regulator of sigma subunit)